LCDRIGDGEKDKSLSTLIEWGFEALSCLLPVKSDREDWQQIKIAILNRAGCISVESIPDNGFKLFTCHNSNRIARVYLLERLKVA